jgi:hypothetical protein
MLENIKITRLDENDLEIFRDLMIFFQEVKKEDIELVPVDKNLKKLLENKKFVICVAYLGEELIGGVTAHEQQVFAVDEMNIGLNRQAPNHLIYDIAVKADFEESKLKEELVSALKREC